MPDSAVRVEIRRAGPALLGIWDGVREVTSVVPRDQWVLVGGLMVQLHALASAPDEQPRATLDIDLLADSRKDPSGTERAAELLLEEGFVAETPYGDREPFTVHRFTRGTLIVDVLGPDGIRQQPKTQPPNVTLSVSGGTQALRRAQMFDVRLPGREPFLVRSPSLAGAILLKARSVVRPHRERDRGDLALLLSCVESPTEFDREISIAERRWLIRAHDSFRPNDPAIGDVIGVDRAQAARQVYSYLCR